MKHVGLLVVLLLLASVTRARVWVWHDERTIWEDAIQYAPQKPRVLLNYGRQLEAIGDRDGARTLYYRALAASFRPQQSEYTRRFAKSAALSNLSHLLVESGDLDQAGALLDSVIAEWPRFAPAHYNRGVIWFSQGNCHQAQREFAQAFVLDHDLPVPPPCVPRS